MIIYDNTYIYIYMIWCINLLLSGYLWARHGEGIVAAVDAVVAWLSATGATVPHGWMVFRNHQLVDGQAGSWSPFFAP